ncbi:sushi, von Willebrand factor type A, EGF and pentraxin domain-containing protein 1-like isoform X3 [Ruditapes philippinarum]|uniref:sushi, von Willebrand factor type A, EGF and pentraxin domain-containing protein 1-like isoform X3 n=1 Tax=Ruditapes philippinarum TaxID=129788 RepID=UPI00295ADE82|nr:sushi, von Willebrand factor type A, EGF and pentraxin domain-containing protein 1-like isoform X3 [Ruditapes philippinarum]
MVIVYKDRADGNCASDTLDCSAMTFPVFFITILVLGTFSTVFSATISRAVSDGSDYIADIKLGKNVQCQGVQVSKEIVLTLEGCVNTKSLKKYKVSVSGETRTISSVQTSDDGSLILLTTKVKKEEKTEFPGIAGSSKGYNRVAYIAGKKGFTDISFEVDKAKKCNKPLDGFDAKSQECLTSEAECTYSNGLPIFGTSGKKDIVISGFALDGGLCSVTYKAAVSVVSSKSWIEENTKEDVDCGKKLPKINDGSYKLDNKKDSSAGATASVTCDKGFKASKETIECQDSGDWEEATCKKIDCGKKLPKIDDGSYKLDNKKDSSVGATASVNCDKGFKASKDKIECQDSGDWDKATCEGIDCGSKLPKIKDGSYKLDNKKDTSSGATASLTCDKGFEESKKKIECQESGDWEEAECKAIDCGKKLPKVKDGSIALDNEKKTTFGSTATLTCDKGYKTESEKITCEASGDWLSASCDIVDCGSVPKIKDGAYKLDKKGKSTYESTATLTCEEDFYAKNNDVTITCEASEDWSKIGKCEEVKDCGKLKSLDNGEYELKGKKTKAGAKAKVTCDNGYDPDVEEIECLVTGKWEKATCIIRDCEGLDKVPKGSLKLDKNKATTVGETATLTCDAGYEPKKGKSTITCLPSGDWEKASCVIKDCGSPDKLDNGSYKVSSTTFGSSAVVKCDAGYEGNKKDIDCLASGKWEKAKCNIKDCGSVGNLTNGVYILTDGNTVYGSTANVSCSYGYGSSDATISCLSTGSWGSATCQRDCGDILPVIDFGSATLISGTLLGDNATVTCNEGYDESVAVISCLASGAWETATCTIHDCGPPSFANMTVVLVNSNTTTTYGETATVTCPGALVPAMGSTITCLGDGWETPSCVEDPCSAGWTLYDSHCYYYEAFSSLGWNAASTDCSDEGGYLAEITSEGELNFLKNLRESSMSAWIGLSDVNGTNTYKWADLNQAPTYTNWATDEPLSSGKCVLMNPVGLWQTQDCSKARNYFCEKA